MTDPRLHFSIPCLLRNRYKPWPGTSHRGWVDSAFIEHMTQRQRADPERLCRQDDAEIVRSTRNLTVRVPVAGRMVWVKRFRSSGPGDSLMYAARPGKAAYAWNAAMTLLEAGFHTPRPLLGLRSPRRLGGAAGMVAFEDIADHLPLRQILAAETLGAAARDQVMAELGNCLRCFHDRGFRHRDLRQGNILAAHLAGRWSFCFLDLNRLRIQAPLTKIQRLREVEKLNLPEAGLHVFFSAYMPGADPDSMAALYRERVAYANRLEHLPAGRLIRKAWYYSWELRAFGRARRPGPATRQ